LRAQAHRRMPPVAVRENAELAAGDQTLDLVLDRFEFMMRISRPGAYTVGDGGCTRRVSHGNGSDIDPIQRRQMVKMNDVIVQGVSNQNEIADVLGICRNFELQGIFNGPNGGHRVNRGAHSAEALRENPAFLNSTGVHFYVNPQVAFDTGYRVDGDAGHGVSPFAVEAARRRRMTLN